ncbi:phospholipase C [Bacillus thuringiensis]|uniref:phospholipase C n=1 Tax=Bacillus thuringiensis TaxID=1428 RepID=UPI003CFE9129
MQRMLFVFITPILFFSSLQHTISAHEHTTKNKIDMFQPWSNEENHKEGKNSHLWIVNGAIDIMNRNTTIVKQDNMAILQEWRTHLENGLYVADHENPYYDSGTFASHFYNPDTDSTYLPFAKHAKETGSTYFRLAGEAYQHKNMQQAFFYLGLSLHYLGDINQPMHAANFTNISYPFGFHSKYENFVDTIKQNYEIMDAEGYWNWDGENPEDWIHQAAVAAKQEFSDIVNSNTKNWFVKAAVSQTYAEKWRTAVTPTTGKRLIEAQRITAGYIQLWFDTYAHH